MEPGAPTVGGMERGEDGRMDGDHQHDAEEGNAALEAGRVDTQLSRDRPACVWPKTITVRRPIKGTSRRRLEIQTAANNVGQNPPMGQLAPAELPSQTKTRPLFAGSQINQN